MPFLQRQGMISIPKMVTSIFRGSDPFLAIFACGFAAGSSDLISKNDSQLKSS